MNPSPLKPIWFAIGGFALGYFVLKARSNKSTKAAIDANTDKVAKDIAATFNDLLAAAAAAGDTAAGLKEKWDAQQAA